MNKKKFIYLFLNSKQSSKLETMIVLNFNLSYTVLINFERDFKSTNSNGIKNPNAFLGYDDLMDFVAEFIGRRILSV